MRGGYVAFAVAVLMGGRAHADGESVNGFPNWQERVMHEWTNRARCDPQVEMQSCGASCGEGACYTPQPPLPWSSVLNRSARFHSDEMAAQAYFAHDSECTLVSNINAIYPGSCTGAASCACVGGTKTCSPTCTTWDQRIVLFGGSAAGEIIASGTDPNGAFYQWLYESYSGTTCGYHQGPPTNGHRYNILMSGPAVGYGQNGASGASVGDFGASGTVGKIASGSHYPRSGNAIDAWANWSDTAAPKTALIAVDGTCTAMTLTRGTATNGAYHVALAGLATGCHRYYFLFHDASDAVITYPTTGSLGIGPAGSCADWDTSRPAPGAGCTGVILQDAGVGVDSGSSPDAGVVPDAAVSPDAGQMVADGGVPSDGEVVPDAGTSDIDGGLDPDALDRDGPGAIGNDGGPGGSTNKSGCGCGTSGGGLGGLAVLGVVAVVLRRRRYL